MKKQVLIISFLALAFVGCSLAKTAEFKGKIASVKVIIDGSKTKVAHRDCYTFFSAPIGSEYTLRITNHSGKRILVVPTVDGINAIDRSEGNWDGSGYVIDAYDHVDVKGFRREDDFQHVQRFTFNEARFSLAERIGNVQNVGVIGAAVFKEYEPPRYTQLAKNMRCCDSAMPTAKKSRCESESRAGTEPGRTVNDPVRKVRFQRATDIPAEILALYYDKEENLISEGILPPPYDPPPKGFLTPFPSNYARGN
ncbi:hypothetical protein KAH81_09325 [bacterium]|nr:hypothetical protein [bacterium]